MMDRTKLQETRNKVKNECARRSGYGSLTVFTGSEYDVPEANAGDIIRAQHGKGIIDPLLAIKDYGDLTLVEKGRVIPDSFDEGLITYVNQLASESMTGNTTSCRSACTGLCVGQCSTECGGCANECNTGCKTVCNESCGTGCKGDCGVGCATGCSGCTAACGTGCASGCNATCKAGVMSQ